VQIKSQALEANIASYHVDVTIDAKYAPLQEVMSRYFGLTESLNTFLKELCHPYRNWLFIVQEARGFSLDYFHLLKSHPKGPEVAGIFMDVFFSAVEANTHQQVSSDAIDNLLLYVQTVLKGAAEEMPRFAPVVNTCFERINDFPNEDFTLFIRSYYQISKIAQALLQNNGRDPAGCTAVNQLLIKYYRRTYEYWLSEDDPLEWLISEAGESDLSSALAGLLDGVLHTDIRREQETLEEIANQEKIADPATLERLLGLKTYNQIVEQYRAIPQALLKAGAEEINGNYWRVIFLFHMMNMPGLSMIHEENLRDINRTLTWLIEHESYSRIMQLIDKTFHILEARTHEFPATALNCVRNMGKGVYKTCESELINFFIDGIIDLGFQAPMISGVGNDWQVRVNPAHLQNPDLAGAGGEQPQMVAPAAVLPCDPPVTVRCLYQGHGSVSQGYHPLFKQRYRTGLQPGQAVEPPVSVVLQRNRGRRPPAGHFDRIGRIDPPQRYPDSFSAQAEPRGKQQPDHQVLRSHAGILGNP